MEANGSIDNLSLLNLTFGQGLLPFPLTLLSAFPLHLAFHGGKWLYWQAIINQKLVLIGTRHFALMSFAQMSLCANVTKPTCRGANTLAYHEHL